MWCAQDLHSVTWIIAGLCLSCAGSILWIYLFDPQFHAPSIPVYREAKDSYLLATKIVSAVFSWLSRCGRLISMDYSNRLPVLPLWFELSRQEVPAGNHRHKGDRVRVINPMLSPCGHFGLRQKPWSSRFSLLPHAFLISSSSNTSESLGGNSSNELGFPLYH